MAMPVKNYEEELQLGNKNARSQQELQSRDGLKKIVLELVEEVKKCEEREKESREILLELMEEAIYLVEERDGEAGGWWRALDVDEDAAAFN